MNSTNIRTSTVHTTRLEKKIVYKWVLHNFCCENIRNGEPLPAIKIEFKLNSEYFTGELSLTGSKCSERQCRLILRSTSGWRVHVKLYAGDQSGKTAYSYLDQSQNSFCMSLWNTASLTCLLNKGGNLITFEVVSVDYAETSNLNYIEVKKFNLSHNLGELFETKKHWDVTFLVADEKLQAHKSILSARSKVFAAMFEHEMKEVKSNVVNIPDIRFDVFEQMIRYIYTDEVLNLKEMVTELLAASDQYDLQNLKLMCEIEMANTLSIENVAETLIYADLYRAQKLKDHSIAFIKVNLQAVAGTEDWNKIVNDHPHLLVHMLDISQI